MEPGFVDGEASGGKVPRDRSTATADVTMDANHVDPATLERLEALAREVRRDVIRMIAAAGSGHPGGALGAADILVSLYFHLLRHRPQEPDWPDRDRFVLSNGHICAALYSCLARSGYFPVDELSTFRRVGSRLQGHPSRVDLPGIETSAGPLGQGLSIANGMALAARVQGRSYHVYCLVGDGEMQEGQIWEALMTAAHYRLDNLTLIVSYNGLQIDGDVQAVKALEPLRPKLEAMGWSVWEIDGHSLPQVLTALSPAARQPGRPTAVIARTVMGKGVAFMENKAVWHGKAPSAEEAQRALAELDAANQDPESTKK